MHTTSESSLSISVIKTFFLLDTSLSKRLDRERYFKKCDPTITSIVAKILKWSYLSCIPKISIPKEVMDRHKNNLKCDDADSRLHSFMNAVESFISDNISILEFKSFIKSLYRQNLHRKEAFFYKKVLKGYLFSVDYSFIRDVLNDGDDFFKPFVSFTKGYSAVSSWDFSFPCIGEVLYDGVKIKALLTSKVEGVFTESQKDITESFSFLIKSAKWFSKKYKKKHVELDVMVVPKNGNYITALSCLDSGDLSKVTLVLIDVAYSSVASLEERLPFRKIICDRINKHDYEIISCPYKELNSNQDLTEFIKSSKRVHLNSLIIKSLKSSYSKTRTDEWAKIRDENILPFKVRVSELIKDEEGKITSFIGKTCNGQHVIVNFITESQREFFIKSKNFWLGGSVEVHWKDGVLFMIRLRPDKNDIIDKEFD